MGGKGRGPLGGASLTATHPHTPLLSCRAPRHLPHPLARLISSRRHRQGARKREGLQAAASTRGAVTIRPPTLTNCDPRTSGSKDGARGVPGAGGMADIVQQLPQLEAMCQALYQSQASGMAGARRLPSPPARPPK